MDPDERLEALRREVLAEQPASPTTPPAPRPASTDRPAPVALPSPPIPEVRPTAPALAPPPQSPRGGHGTQIPFGLGDLDVRALLADRSLSDWLGIGLLVVGGYLVLSWIVPGVAIIGSVALLAIGVVPLYLHFVRGTAPWALYVGATLVGMGAARVLGDLLPGAWHGATAIGVGVAFLAIGYLRHSQAGGYGWQGIVGGAALGLGLVQLVLGWLPGSPGLFDLVTPVILLGLGALLVLGTRRFGDRERKA
jgi:hypothetical protein